MIGRDLHEIQKIINKDLNLNRSGAYLEKRALRSILQYNRYTPIESMLNIVDLMSVKKKIDYFLHARASKNKLTRSDWTNIIFWLVQITRQQSN